MENELTVAMLNQNRFYYTFLKSGFFLGGAANNKLKYAPSYQTAMM